MMGRGAEGVMLARKMGSDPVLREIPVLIITGIREQIAYLFPGQAVHPHFVAVDELVEKPVEPGLLLQKAATMIAAAEARRAASETRHMTATTTTKLSFREEVENLLHAEEGASLIRCIQCATCSAACPVVEFMDHTPRLLIGLINAGMKDEVMASNTFWTCASCYACTEKCPEGIRPADVMYALTRYSLWKDTFNRDWVAPEFSRRFTRTILRTGQVLRAGLRPRLHLRGRFPRDGA